MLKSKVIVTQIERPWEEVYDFLVEPLNFPQWAANFDSKMVHVEGRDWLVEVPSGRIVLRFAEPNDWGVLDYSTFPQGARSGPVTPVRLYRNGDGAELQFVCFQREGVSDDEFASDAEWIATDLLRLKTVLETRV